MEKNRCAELVQERTGPGRFYQCERFGKYKSTEDGKWYCAQHLPSVVEEREKKRNGARDMKEKQILESDPLKSLSKKEHEQIHQFKKPKGRPRKPVKFVGRHFSVTPAHAKWLDSEGNASFKARAAFDAAMAKEKPTAQ